MSDSDDADILADIRALEEVLALDTNEESQQRDRSSQKLVILSDIDSENDDDNKKENVDDDYLDYISTNRHIDASLNAYDINTKLLTGLTIVKKQLTVLLEKSEQKIKLLDEKMILSKDNCDFTSKLTISHAGMPYFKDKDFFSAPKNYDAKLKEARGELFLPFLKKPSRWSRKDREILFNAIKDQAIEFVLSEDFNKGVEESDRQGKRAKLVHPKNWKEMIEAMGEREFDWHKISAMNFDNKHSPGECQAMWNVYLHPKFKKDEWTSTEDKKLLRYANEYKCQNWDAITQILGTKRSAYQCFIRYNTIKKLTFGHNWTKAEDKHLYKVIDAIRIGDYISWTDIANHMRHRTKQQVYIRWTYRQAPHLRKGRFTYLETTNLLKAVQKYGKDFCKIANVVMPHRTSVQLHQHYTTITTNDFNIWSIDDDVTLIDLQLKYRNNWSKIATYFSNKSRTQVRHRYSALLKYVEKGISLENIPRPPLTIRNRKYLKSKATKLKSLDKASLLKLPKQSSVEISDIQLRLYETLCFPPLNKFNDSEKELYDVEELMLNTKKLYNALNVLNANLDIPDDFLDYVQLNNKDKQLLVSLKKYINALKSTTQNKERVEEYRTRMFGCTPEVSESDFFIPPLPFDGHVRNKKIKYQHKTSINYDLDVNEKFLVNKSLDFSVTSYMYPLITIEEHIQFSKFGQFLTNDYHNYHQNKHLYKSIKCVLSSAPESTLLLRKALLKSDELNVSIKSNLTKQLNEQNIEETNNIDEEVERRTSLNNAILPNQATLLGWKNLLLWKLLYDYQAECVQPCKSIASPKIERKQKQTTTDSSPEEIESDEYKLLRTRLLQLFKIPIGLSNTILQTEGPETIFSLKPPDEKKAVSLKRKCEDTKKTKVNNKPQPVSDTTMSNAPVLRKRRKVSLK
ncbi:hypothetical protein PUN28_011137 [Cardiocondyla obscurior]|uniref:snRNA-activating protein complex subunit 4 n=1 Tax=Cardiocondyla obscurior TaxID=286306 RepID=A0AAW2FMZ4_9HYME